MASAENYRERVFDVIEHEPNRKGFISFEIKWNSPKEAKVKLSEIRNTQKRLRLIKSQINSEIKIIRHKYDNEVGEVNPGIGATIFLGKGAAKKIAASKKRDIRAQKQNEIRPYEIVKQLISEILVKYDIVKNEIIIWIDENKDT